MLCVQCGESSLNAEGRCPVCGGLTGDGLHTETWGMNSFNKLVEQTVKQWRHDGAKLLSVELDYLTDDEYHVVLSMFRRVASIAGIPFTADLDKYWVLQCWVNTGEGRQKREGGTP